MRIYITDKKTGKTIDKKLISMRQKESGIYSPFYTIEAVNLETGEVETFIVDTATHYIDIA